MFLNMSSIFKLMREKLQSTRTMPFLKDWWMQNQILMWWSLSVRIQLFIFWIFSSSLEKLVKENISIFFYSFFVFQQEFKPLFGCWNTNWRISMFTETPNQSLIASRCRTEKERKGFHILHSHSISLSNYNKSTINNKEHVTTFMSWL